jgi:hypothetical protein
MSAKSLAVIAVVVTLPFGISAAWSQSQSLVGAVSAETASPAAGGGIEYLNLSKNLKCKTGESSCTASINGKKGKLTLITSVSCVAFVNNGTTMFGAITAGKTSPIAHAIIPVASRTMSDTAEASVLEGPTQVALGPDDKVTLGVAATVDTIGQVICNVTGTITKL